MTQQEESLGGHGRVFSVVHVGPVDDARARERTAKLEIDVAE